MTAILETKIESNKILLHGVVALPDQPLGLGVLFLHGGGHSNSERYLKIQEIMAKSGITTLAFDFRGCGKSEGKFSESSLENRLEDAGHALNHFMKSTSFQEEQIFLWGSSMGGHIATRLSEKHVNLSGIILQSAAAYGIEVESIPFGPEFTDKLNELYSWQNSLAFSSFEKFPGRKLVIYGSDDDVIPTEIQEKYQGLAGIQNVYVLKDGIHSMLRPQNQTQQQVWGKMIDLSIKFILQK